jgi:hypothetical protein
LPVAADGLDCVTLNRLPQPPAVSFSTLVAFTRRLLLTTENASAPTHAATVDVPSTVTDVSGALGLT